MTVTVDDSSDAAKDISNDVNSITFDTPRGVIDVTGLDVASLERLAGLADGIEGISGPGFQMDSVQGVGRELVCRVVGL